MHGPEERQLALVLAFQRAQKLAAELLRRRSKPAGDVEQDVEAVLRRLFVDERQYVVDLQASRFCPNEQGRIDPRFPQRQCARDALDVHAVTDLEEPGFHQIPISEQGLVRRHAEGHAPLGLYRAVGIRLIDDNGLERRETGGRCNRIEDVRLDGHVINRVEPRRGRRSFNRQRVGARNGGATGTKFFERWQRRVRARGKDRKTGTRHLGLLGFLWLGAG